MDESTINGEQRQFSSAASLAGIGLYLNHVAVFEPVRHWVKINQKTVKDAPSEKLYDSLITLLAGGHGIVEVNTRLRSDPALQAAFGRQRCAEQSVIQETLNACTAENVAQMQQAMQSIYRRHSQGYRHDYAAAWQILDVDLTGLPCGPKAAFATKGYFAHARGRRGRQLGRVLATRYQEVVVDQLYPGTQSLVTALPGLVQAAAEVLALDAAKRRRTLLRIDGGGGSVADINWALDQGYAVHAKDYAALRVREVAEQVATWWDDPQVAGRQVARVTAPTTLYHRPVTRIAVRCRRADGQWATGVIVSSLPPEEVLRLTHTPQTRDEQVILCAYAHLYDQRGGGVETSFKEDKQGLGLTTRSKKRFEAQQIVMWLGALAHNILMWVRRWLASTQPKLAHYGVLRLLRDLLRITGFLVRDAHGRIVRLALNRAAPLAASLAHALQALLGPLRIDVILAEN